MATIPISLTIAGDTVSAVAVANLTRSDTGAAPSGVSLPIALTLVGGAWTGSFVDASPPPYYSVILSVTYSDATVQTYPAFTLNSGVVAAGAYFSISDVRVRMGEYNESVAADPDQQGNAAIIALHEQDAVRAGNGEINTILQQNGFATPAIVGNLDALRDLGTDIGVFRVYRIRGEQDKGKVSAYRQAYEDAKTEIEELCFMNRGGFTRATGYSDAPLSVAPTVNSDGRRISTVVTGPYWDGNCWRGW